MKSYQVQRDIAAQPDAVWAVLTDAERLASGDTGVLKIEGVIGGGKKIVVWSEVQPKRGFPATVTEFVPGRSMKWTGGLPLGLFKGERRFELSEIPTGTRFSMREDFSGPLLGLIGRSMPDLQPSFEKFADGLVAVATGSHHE